MKRYLLIVLFMLSIGLPIASAQESTEVPTVESITATPVETSTPEATVEPTSSPTPEAPVDLPDDAVVTNGAQLLLLLALAAFGGGGLVAILSRFLELKEARDVGEKLYQSLPPEQQEWMRQRLVEAEETNRRLIDYLKAITDGLPNAAPPNPFRGDVTRPPTTPE
jgi:hypothetical protein